MLLKERELLILRLFDEIWYHIMNDRAKKLAAARKIEIKKIRWINIVTRDFNTAKQWARTNTVRISAFYLQLLTGPRYNERITPTVVFFKIIVLSATSISPPGSAAAKNTRSTVFLAVTHWLLSTPVISRPPTTSLPPYLRRRGGRSTRRQYRLSTPRISS